MSSFNQNPIIINVPMTQSFWTILRGLGVLGANQGKPIQPTSIKWIDPGASASYSITDGVGSTIIDQGDTGPDFLGGDIQQTFRPPRRWRDFQVVILSGGELIIDYV